MLHFVYEFFCIFFAYDEAAFFGLNGTLCLFSQATKIRQQKYLDSKFDCLAAIVMKKNDVSTNCTVGLYMFDLFLRRNLLCWFGWFFFPTSCKGFLWREQLKYRSCENDCLIWISLCANVHVLCKRECSCLIIKQFELRRFDL